MSKIIDKFGDMLIKSMVKAKFSMSRIVETFLTLLAFWWSIILLLPTSTFSTSTAYKTMEMLASEPIWGTMFFMLGSMHLSGLWHDNTKVIQYSLLASTITWMFIGTNMLIGAFASTGAGMYILVSFLSASLYIYKGFER